MMGDPVGTIPNHLRNHRFELRMSKWRINPWLSNFGSKAIHESWTFCWRHPHLATSSCTKNVEFARLDQELQHTNNRCTGHSVIPKSEFPHVKGNEARDIPCFCWPFHHFWKIQPFHTIPIFLVVDSPRASCFCCLQQLQDVGTFSLSLIDICTFCHSCIQMGDVNMHTDGGC